MSQNRYPPAPRAQKLTLGFVSTLLVGAVAFMASQLYGQQQNRGANLEEEGLFPTTMEELLVREPDIIPAPQEDPGTAGRPGTRSSPPDGPLVLQPSPSRGTTGARPMTPSTTQRPAQTPGSTSIISGSNAGGTGSVRTTQGGSRNDLPSFIGRVPTEPAQTQPRVLSPNQPSRTRPVGDQQDGIPTQILLPAPEPVAEPITSPGAPTIIFEEGQPGLEMEEATGEGPEFDPGALLEAKEYEEVEAFTLEQEDVGLANALGWSYYEDGNRPKAIEWFEQTLRWDENYNEAAYGLALSLYNEGFLDQAEAVARWKVNAYPGMRNVLGDIYMTRAISSFRDEKYEVTERDLRSLQQFRPMNRGEEVLYAWSVYHLGDLDRAETLFTELYRQDRDEASAVGLYATLSRQQDWEAIDRAADQMGGPLRDIYDRYTSERYYERRLFLKARQISPDPVATIENVATPSVSLSAEFIARQGDEGLSELYAYYGPRVSGRLFQNEINRFDISIGLVNLDAGTLADREFIGLKPRDPNTGYVETPKTSYNGMVEPRIAYYREGWFAPFAEIGMTPLGGEVGSTFVGRAGFLSYYDSGAWKLELYRESVTETLLSYTGMRDPYTGLKWGRVVETSLKATMFYSISDVLSLYGLLSAGQITGENVADNQFVRFDLAFNRAFSPKGFHYVNFGPSLTTYGYSENLSFFTYGHGGYFSPSFLVQGLVNFQFMTEEERIFLIKGEIGAGGQANKQEAAPLFPLNADGRIYEESSESSFIMVSNISGMFLLLPQWGVGGGLTFNRSPSYEEVRADIFTTIFFEPRIGLFETDFVNQRYLY